MGGQCQGWAGRPEGAVKLLLQMGCAGRMAEEHSRPRENEHKDPRLVTSWCVSRARGACVSLGSQDVFSGFHEGPRECLELESGLC